MTVSIALCTFNGSAYIREQLDSIASQTRLPSELVVCDDGSTDDTRDIVQTWARDVPFPVTLHRNDRNIGTIKNFEMAISLCQGDIIALADQDDRWHPAKLAQVETLLTAQPDVALTFTDAEVVDEELRPLGYTMWKTRRFGRAEQRLVKEGKAFQVLLRRNVITGATMAFRSAYKPLILPIARNPVHVHDEWIAFLLSCVAPIDFVPVPLIDYRQRPGQQIGAHPPTGIRMLYAAAKRNARQRNVEQDRAAIAWLNGIKQRLIDTSGAFTVDDDVLDAIDAKMGHLEVRVQMPDRWIRRAPRVLTELLTYRYHRFSKGKWDAARDLLPW